MATYDPAMALRLSRSASGYRMHPNGEYIAAMGAQLEAAMGLINQLEVGSASAATSVKNSEARVREAALEVQRAHADRDAAMRAINGLRQVANTPRGGAKLARQILKDLGDESSGAPKLGAAAQAAPASIPKPAQAPVPAAPTSAVPSLTSSAGGEPVQAPSSIIAPEADYPSPNQIAEIISRNPRQG